jgi:hypothetical protein
MPKGGRLNCAFALARFWRLQARLTPLRSRTANRGSAGPGCRTNALLMVSPAERSLQLAIGDACFLLPEVRTDLAREAAACVYS